LPYATETDKNMHLWWYTKQWYLKTYNTIITCPYCQKEVNVLDEIKVVGQYIRHFYHASCYERLPGEDDDKSKETIPVIIVNSNGSREEVSEVIA
jgi:glutaredoxin